jgi:hypothetical protein
VPQKGIVQGRGVAGKLPVAGENADIPHETTINPIVLIPIIKYDKELSVPTKTKRMDMRNSIK